ncbi:MAG: AtuA-related protein [Balneolaceae bacterium]
MPKARLIKIAHGRSGDKGSSSNVGIIARHPDIYPFLKEKLTPAVVKDHMKQICKGKVERYELPNIGALNFVLHDSLDGGGTVSLKLDAQGKTHAFTLLRMELEVPEELLELAGKNRLK